MLWKVWGKKIGLWYVHRSVTLSLRKATMLVDYVFTTSSESFRINTPKRLTLGHGIDMDTFTAAVHERSDVLRLLTVGRIAESKNIAAMIEAVSAIHKEGIAVTFSIVGAGVLDADGVYEETLRTLVRERSLDAVVHFEGAVTQSELPACLSKADVFLNLSATSSVDKAVLEALACGVPVVSSNIAFKDLLTPYGLFVEDTSPAVIHDAIKNAQGMDIRALTEKVRAEHSLSHLIPLVLEKLAA
jgi:glycosyltransferase involved in cell wall biosynthesis